MGLHVARYSNLNESGDGLRIFGTSPTQTRWIATIAIAPRCWNNLLSTSDARRMHWRVQTCCSIFANLATIRSTTVHATINDYCRKIKEL
eukprot:m.84241 g.84241  ORF g.84241 m.84241 type:complete len:90 (-) comp25725_c0_seq4:856-1125(-)